MTEYLTKRPKIPMRLIAGLAALGMANGFAGCGEKTQYEYEPIQVPEGAIPLGMSGNIHSESGLSFKIHATDAEAVSCGSATEQHDVGFDTTTEPTKEVQVLASGLAQVTCHGAGEGFPYTFFPSEHPLSPNKGG